MSEKTYTVAIAGSTERTLWCAQALWNHPSFHLEFVLTPTPKPIGRKQILTKNPLHQWAISNNLPAVLIENKIDSEVKNKIESQNKVDFLLVVDFGYLVPEWLLDWPKIMPLNIHPSELPRWRGASPGQMVLLHGEAESAITLMQMNERMDEGPILYQEKFEVDQTWNRDDYYQYAFDMLVPQLGDLMIKVATGEIQPQPQPAESTTPAADHIDKKDAFYDWAEINNPEKAIEIDRAIRAYNPWPLLWTKIPTNKGEKRMQILEASLENGQLQLEKVKIEGMETKPWTEVKNILTTQN